MTCPTDEQRKALDEKVARQLDDLCALVDSIAVGTARPVYYLTPEGMKEATPSAADHSTESHSAREGGERG
jgi:hypothetical protein